MSNPSSPSIEHASYVAAERYMPLPVPATHGRMLSCIEALVPLVGCVAAGIHAYYYGLAFGTLLVAGFMGLITGLGVTVGFHRLFTHRSFETTPAVRVALAIMGCMSGQGHFFLWVATHRRHHRFSDHHGDPHTPHQADESTWSRLRNFYHAHFGWSLADQLTDESLQYIPDLTADRALCRVQRLHLLWLALGLALPALLMYAIAGTAQAAIGGLLWGGFVRLTFTNQTTYAVNSICHLWGRRPYDSADHSRNNLFVALFSMGEGWHNNHHAFPTSARHGHGWQEPDLSWTFIKLLRVCGLAWNVKTPTAAQLKAKSRASRRKPARKSVPAAVGRPLVVGLSKPISVGKA
jgi:stearoyl-CoA desaturase (delta-9 desaturase)